MGKADFSHVASQSILLLIFLVIFVLGPPPEALVITSDILILLLYFQTPAGGVTIPEMCRDTQRLEKQ